MNPHLSSGVFSQVWWPGNGGRPYDDCWVLADLMAIHAVAPWVSLPSVGGYRAAAGNPDEPNVPDGGTLRQSARAMRALWPALGRLITVHEGSTWERFRDQMTTDRVASVSLLSGALPPGYRYGFDGTHRVTIARVDSGWLFANPLAGPHSRYRSISGADLREAMTKYPAAGMWAIVMPSVGAAFKTHSLYPR